VIRFYVGPTAATLERSVPNAFPPAERGTLAQLLDEQPTTVVLVDGRFHDVLAVGHTEILQLLNAGFEVWGLGSVGAIRAAELHAAGMRGWGVVYRHYLERPNTPDDEVALLHNPEPPYDPISEPMLHLRVAIDHLARIGAIDQNIADHAKRHLAGAWFGDRTVAELARLLGRNVSRRVSQELASFDRFRIKTHDLRSFMRCRPWLQLHL
jgi:hypothetical protein